MEGAAQTIVSNVGQLVGEEFRVLRAVGGEVVELRDELATMNALLRMQSEAEDGAVDHFVREWMKQLRELVYDAEDCVDLYIFRIKCRHGDGFLAWSRRMLATLFPRHHLAGKIKALRLRAVAISERHARYGVSREALRRSPPVAAVASSARALRPANDSADRLVGIRDQANTLAGRVKAMTNDQEATKLKVFSIVGFGGLGKTTLAMEVCRLLEPEFDRQAQVSVSQAFDGGKDLSALLKRVLQQMVKRKADNEKVKEEDSMGGYIDKLDVDQLVGNLQVLLKGKRYLIVIDDVWTIAAWDAISSKLPDSKCGNRIIVTTRIETVAKECSDASAGKDYIHHMMPLKFEDSKRLFLSRACGSSSMNDASYTGELKVITDNILKKCAGLPLAIVSIGSLLASYKYPESKDMWETICKSIGSQMESNPTLEGMRHILTLSYNHLPYHLKGCMMSLGIFPEDYEIRTDRLLYRWIAEGLVEEKRGLTSMEVAEGYFDELVSRSMIDPASSIGYNGRREACRVHDMMLEVMVSKSLEANFSSLLGGQYEGMSYDRIRRLSIHGGAKDDSPSEKRGAGGERNIMERVDVQHVRSLSMFELQGKKLFDRLGEFTLLRVLDLEDCEGLENKHVEDICRMYLLRFLSMRGTNISVLPKQVGELEHLQVLDVDQTCLKELPETMTRLEKLERLRFCNKYRWFDKWNPPRGLRKMRALREVDCIILEDVQVAQELGELGKLREVTIFVTKSESSENQDVLKALVVSLSKLYSLRSLRIGGFGQRPKVLNFLSVMPSPPRLLRSLYLDGDIDEFPSWVTSLHYLVEISFIWSHFEDDQVFGVLCKLPNLQNIKMFRDSYVDTELVARTAHNFPVLRTLSVSSVYCGFPKVLKFEEGSMDKLEELSVSFGDHERSIVGIQHLKNLKEVKLIGWEYNSALSDALDQLKSESKRRLDSNQFQFTVGVRYECSVPIR